MQISHNYRYEVLMCLYPNGIMALIYEGPGLYITSDAY